MFRVSKVGLNPAVGCAGIGGVWIIYRIEGISRWTFALRGVNMVCAFKMLVKE